tara:strand:+ start:66 stop:467 length:402 start_codon:yes stop_codon:yes gene_type:complete
MSQKIIITPQKLKEFGFIFGLGIPLIIGFLIPFINGHNFYYWTIFIGIPALIIAIINPQLLKNAYILWIKLGNILGWINSKLILGFVFVLVLMPISVIMKLFKYDPLRRKLSKSKTSYRELTKNHKTDFTKIF